MNGRCVVAGNTYTYDAVGNRLTNVEQSADASLHHWTYAYDSLNRLVSAGSDCDPFLQWTYDAVGDRLIQTVPHQHGHDDPNDGGQGENGSGGQNNNQNIQYAYNSKDQMVSANNQVNAFDADGNLLTSTVGHQTTTYTWDAEDRLTQVTFPDASIEQNSYNGDGLRVSTGDRLGNTQQFVWAGMEIIDEYQRGRVAAQYFLAGDRQAVLEPGFGGGQGGYRPTRSDPNDNDRGGFGGGYPGSQNSIRWHLTDGLGSVVGLTDSYGQVTDTYRYDAWGNTVQAAGGTYNPFRYTGQQLDAGTGMYYLRSRFLNPSVGRFVSRDNGRMTTLSTYAYCYNDPTGFIDSNGASPLPPIIPPSIAQFMIRMADWGKGGLNGNSGIVVGVRSNVEIDLTLVVKLTFTDCANDNASTTLTFKTDIDITKDLVGKLVTASLPGISNRRFCNGSTVNVFYQLFGTEPSTIFPGDDEPVILPGDEVDPNPYIGLFTQTRELKGWSHPDYSFSNSPVQTYYTDPPAP